MEAVERALTKLADNGMRRGRRRERKADDNGSAHAVHISDAQDTSSAADGGYDDDDGRCVAVKKKPYSGRPPSVPGSRPCHRVQAPTTPIQRVIELCEAAFKGPGTVPSPVEVLALRTLLDNLRAEDVGVTNDQSFFHSVTDNGGPTPGISCMSIASHDNFSVCVFFLPAALVMPLHDHPGMTVFSRLLVGSMRVKAYDWVDDKATDGVSPVAPLCSTSLVHAKLAKVVVDAELVAPCRTTVLFPASGGNMHAFTALTMCAVLDVMGPSYSTVDGRDCYYYKARPCDCKVSRGGASAAAAAMECFAWLEEIQPPQGLMIPMVPYTGPPICYDR